jgi:hypothetical protein
MRYFGLMLALALFGCHRGSQVENEDKVNVSVYHRIGVPTFGDPRGKGAEIADGVAKGLQDLTVDIVERKLMDQTMLTYKPDSGQGLGTEALMEIKRLSLADAIILGRMSRDWKAGQITIVETNMGDPVIRVLLKTKNGKPFKDSDAVVKEFLRVFADLQR